METNKELMRAEFEACKDWANKEGFDTAHTYDSDRSKWIFLNPCTADIWKCWQARAAISQRSEAVHIAVPTDRLQNWIDLIHDNERSMGDRLQSLSATFGGLLRGDAVDKYPLRAIREQQQQQESEQQREMRRQESEEAARLQILLVERFNEFRRPYPEGLMGWARAALAAQSAPAPSAAVGEKSDWRRLALQFDGPRMSALWHLRAMVNDPVEHKVKAEEFLAAQPTPAQGDAVPVADPPYEFSRYSLDYINKRKPELSEQEVAEMIKRGWAGYEGDIWRAATRQSSADAGDAARAVVAAWDECNGFPDTNMEISAIGNAVDALRAAIAAQGGKGGAG